MAARARLAFLDTETTDLSEVDGRIWEVGLILRGPEHHPDLPFTAHVDAVDPREFHPKALEVGGFQRRYGMDAATMEERHLVNALRSFLSGRHLVGANPAFDQKHLEALFRRHGVEPTWHHRLIDVEVMGMVHLGLPEPMGLQQTALALGVPFRDEDLHTAYGDAALARTIYDLIAHGIEPGQQPEGGTQ